MNKGLIVFGAPGSGTSTLGLALAKEMDFLHIETDDISGTMIDVPPFRIRRTFEERVELLQTKIAHCSGFVISGSMWDWGEVFIPFFNLAVFIITPTYIRIDRLEERERKRHGERICEGGDMYDNHRDFIEWAKSYDTNNPDRSLKLHEEWIKTLHCPVLRVDGSISVSENVELIKRCYYEM